MFRLYLLIFIFNKICEIIPLFLTKNNMQNLVKIKKLKDILKHCLKITFPFFLLKSYFKNLVIFCYKIMAFLLFKIKYIILNKFVQSDPKTKSNFLGGKFKEKAMLTYFH